MATVLKKILFLPDAGSENPFQHQLIGFLRKNGFKVGTAPSRRFWATLRAVQRHKPDVLYYDWIQSFTLGRNLVITLLKCFCFCIEVLYVKKIRRISVLHTLHNIQNHDRRWIWIERRVYYYFLRQCNLVRVYSETTKRKVIRLYRIDPDRIKVIQDVPYHHHYPRGAGLQESLTHLSLPTNAFVYLFLGTLRPYKGLENLIASFERIAGPDDYLVIAGGGHESSYVNSIKAAADRHPRVILHPYFVPDQNVQYYFTAANVVVLPFKNVEHSGSTDLALSFARPIITLNTPLLNQLLSHQQKLLFNKPNELAGVMRLARQLDLKGIGTKNFLVADNTNYRDLLLFFAQ